MRMAIERALSHGLLRIPGPVLLRMARETPRVVDGQALDPHIQFALKLEARRRRPRIHEMSPTEARRVAAWALAVLDLKRPDVAKVHDTVARVGDRHPVPVRVFTPANHRGGLLVFFHGGGGVIGSVESYDTTCRYIANLARTIVVSVDYRLAPEHPYPAGLDDAITAYHWARDQAEALGADPTRVAVGGDSMGGNFAALVCQHCRRTGEAMPAFQWLIYPGTDFTRSMPSHQLFASEFALDRSLLDWFRGHYLAGHDPGDHRVSPLWNDRFDGLSPALVVTAGFDPLRDEGRAYADRLRDAGVDTSYECCPSMIHGFVQMAGAFRVAREATAEAVRALGDALA